MRALAFAVPDPDAPMDSWWVCPDRDFAARRDAEQARMARSRFGRLKSSGTFGPVDPTLARRDDEAA